MAVVDVRYHYDPVAELNRKVRESLESAVNARERGQLSVDRYIGYLEGLRDASSGLVDAILSIAVEGDLNLLDPDDSLKVLFASDDGLMLVRYKYGSDRAALLQYKQGAGWSKRSLNGNSDELDPVREAYSNALKMIARLDSLGYRRIA